MVVASREHRFMGRAGGAVAEDADDGTGGPEHVGRQSRGRMQGKRRGDGEIRARVRPDCRRRISRGRRGVWWRWRRGGTRAMLRPRSRRGGSVAAWQASGSRASASRQRQAARRAGRRRAEQRGRGRSKSKSKSKSNAGDTPRRPRQTKLVTELVTRLVTRMCVSPSCT